MIHRKEVEHIAKLARLGLTEAEIKNFQKELSSILDYFNSLKEVDLKLSFLTPLEVKKSQEKHKENKPLTGLTRKKKGLVENVTREDEVKEQSPKTTDALLEAAPEKEKKHIKVKAVL